jgi:undecaprenyl-diphosphatase
VEALNHALSLWINASEHPNAVVLTLAFFLAERVIWARPF